MSSLKQQFEQQGFVVLHDVLTSQELDFYKNALTKVGANKKKASWTMPDGVIQHEDFWPTVWNETVLKAVKEILGEDFKYMQHNDLHLGYSSFAWHRDSINRGYDEHLPDWRESIEPYQIVRCGYYLQPEENNYKKQINEYFSIFLRSRTKCLKNQPHDVIKMGDYPYLF